MTLFDDLASPPTEEIITNDELTELLSQKSNPRTYIGFEISGRVHLGTGLVCMAKVGHFQRANFETTVFLADWHSWINRKLGNDLERIREVAGGYFKEALAVSLDIMGGDSSRTKFVMGSDIYDNEYWASLVSVSKSLSLKRVQRMVTIMGRRENEAVDFAQLIYPPMQIADIFQLKVDVAHGGMDQRKAHVGAREVAPNLGRKKPIALHHHLLQGLVRPPIWPPPPKTEIHEFRAACKMSKSQPHTAIFIEDSPDEIKKKVTSAFCPEKVSEFNPIIDIVEHIILPKVGKLKVERDSRFGGDIEIVGQEELRRLYSRGLIHPLDLKNTVINSLVEILSPARAYFERHTELTEIFRHDYAKVTR